MKIEQVAVQFYTLRDFLTTREGYINALDRVKDMGYRSIQVSGPRPVAEAEIAELCRERNLVINSSHEDPQEIVNTPASAIARLRGLGCTLTAYPWPAGIDFGAARSVTQLVTRLESAAQAFSAAGMILTYHNHQTEFRRADDGQLGLERIYRETQALQGELDTYWVQYGGGNIVEWCQRLKHRLPLIHLKDYRIQESGAPEFAEIGYGSIDFTSVIRAAEASGCQWFIVEQDTCPGNPFDSLEKSFRYIHDHLVD